jgi:UDPglucose 6-dehydrogenase
VVTGLYPEFGPRSIVLSVMCQEREMGTLDRVPRRFTIGGWVGGSVIKAVRQLAEAGMQICVVGTGYVGLVVGTCLSDQGFRVTCVDRDVDKISMLSAGRVPIYEPGLEDILRRSHREGRLAFTTESAEAIAAADIIFIAVGTPQSEDGSADLGAVMAVAEEIGRHISKPATVVIKSTVPVGTARKVRTCVEAVAEHPVQIVSNPEFLKEGAAVTDFTRPDRIVIGCDSPQAVKVMQRLYSGLVRTGRPIVFMDNQSAELTKYASNVLLATKISFMNEMSRLCEVVGADIEAVRLGTGSDSRIGSKFLFAGAGFGGSCFPKDIRALTRMGEAAGIELSIPVAVDEINERQKRVLGAQVRRRFGDDLTGRIFGLWGLAFKPRTDDVREAPALVLLRELIDAGAMVRVTDPEAMDAARVCIDEWPNADRVQYVDTAEAAAVDADAVILVTEWSEFRNPDFSALKAVMRSPVVFDGRNVLVPEVVHEAGFEYHGIGRAPLA